MPPAPWTGYGRFCPLAVALDVVGERWTLVIVQELLKRPSRYSELAQRVPGIGTTVLTARLRKLESAGVLERRPGAVGEGVLYALTERGAGLTDALEALRRWGVGFLTDPNADGSEAHHFVLAYVTGIDELEAGEFGLIVDDTPSTLRFRDGHLDHRAGPPAAPELVVRTSRAFMDRWATGTVTWDDGLSTGEVTTTGDPHAWTRWLAATGYLTQYPQPDTT